MWADFVKDPAKDIAIADRLWSNWFGASAGVGAGAGGAPAGSATAAIHSNSNSNSNIHSTAEVEVGMEMNSTSIGPINDACFQDGGQWKGPPDWTGSLIPPRCVIN
jgi:hypothetical protein